MPYFLAERAPNLPERMDSTDSGVCDPIKLHNTYRRFALVNRVVSGWGRLYRRLIRPELQAGAGRLLDIGFGGGDIPLRLARWAAQDGFALEVTAIDPDPRAVAHARAEHGGGAVRFEQALSRELVTRAERFDLVVSNHLLHHLDAAAFTALCHDSAQLSRRLVVHNDIHRADLAYLGFALTGPLFRNSFITEDGLTSIRRAYSYPELVRVAPAGWRVACAFPYRLLLSYRHPIPEAHKS